MNLLEGYPWCGPKCSIRGRPQPYTNLIEYPEKELARDKHSSLFRHKVSVTGKRGVPYESSGCNIDKVIFFAAMAPMQIIHFDNSSKKVLLMLKIGPNVIKRFTSVI